MWPGKLLTSNFEDFHCVLDIKLLGHLFGPPNVFSPWLVLIANHAQINASRFAPIPDKGHSMEGGIERGVWRVRGFYTWRLQKIRICWPPPPPLSCTEISWFCSFCLLFGTPPPPWVRTSYVEAPQGNSIEWLNAEMYQDRITQLSIDI